MLNRFNHNAANSSAIEDLENRKMFAAAYPIGINMNDASSAMVPRATSVMKDLGVKAIRIWSTVNDFNSRTLPASFQRAIDYDRAGFSVLMEVHTKDGKVPNADAVKGWFSWAAKQPGIANAVDQWQIGNEVDSNYYWKGSLSQYVNGFLKPASEGLRPQGEDVVSAGPSWNPQDIQEMIDHGMLDYVDYVGAHPYANGVSQVKQRINQIVEVVDGRKPIAATEWNVRGYEGDKTKWANAVTEAYPYIKAAFDLNYYFCLEVQDTPAGPGGILKTNGAFNQPFYNAFATFKNGTGNSGSDNDNEDNDNDNDDGGNNAPAGSNASVSGTLFNDTDKDGQFDSSEDATGSRIVFIDNDADGKLDAGEKSTTSDSKGNYKFAGLAKGTYKVTREFPNGYELSNNDAGYVNATVSSASQLLKGVNLGTKEIGKTGSPSTPSTPSTPSQPSTPSNGSPAVTGLRLIDTQTNRVIPGYTNITRNVMIQLSSLPKNIAVEAVGNSATGSMILSAQGKKFTESNVPYAYFGDDEGKFDAWSAKTGTHTFGATAFTGENATGSKSSTAYISLTFY